MSILLTIVGSSILNLQVPFKVFSGGELHPTLPEANVFEGAVEVVIDCYMTDGSDIMKLCLVADALRQQSPNVKIGLRLAYLPYARQDRVANEGESLSIKVIANIINSLDFNYVLTYDNHSDVATALINKIVNVSQERLLESYFPELLEEIKNSEVLLVSPDAGADKKIHDLAKICGGVRVIHAYKDRDTKTGAITNTRLDHQSNVGGKRCLIVDDICDGGYTFIKLAECLREAGANSVELYVTHGIFSKGMKVFDNVIDKVYTTNSFDNTTLTAYNPIKRDCLVELDRRSI